MIKISANKYFFLVFSFFLNLFFFLPFVFSHQAGNALERPVQTRMVQYERGYKTTFSYYPVGYTGIYDFSVRVENINSGIYYTEDLEVCIIDSQGMEYVHYRPFLFDKHIYKMRYGLSEGGRYRFIIQFTLEDRLQKIEFPFEIQEMRIEDLCQWCGMQITNAKTTYFLTVNTGEVKKACCVHCAMSFENKFHEELVKMETLDYTTGAKVESRKAWFVQNSNITLENSMPPYILAFASKKSARSFWERCQGDIVTYAELVHDIMEGEGIDFLPAEENEELILSAKLIKTIKENYYCEVDEDELKKLTLKGIMSSLDKGSLLEKVQPSSLDFIRGFERDKTIADARIIQGTIGYIKISYFGRRTKEDFLKEMEPMKERNIRGLIIDLRDNPGGSLKEATQIMQYFLTNGKLLASYQSKDQSIRYFSQTGEKWLWPLVLLINENTASSAEIFAATLRHYKRVTLVGINSYGKGTIQKAFPLDQNHSLILTVGKCCVADGTTLHGTGVRPDHDVEGEEEQMDFALNYIEEFY